MAEKSLIDRVRRRIRRNARIPVGIGDDCAVLQMPPGHELLVTTDFTLEGVHFRREWHPAEVVGRRCLTRGLSDIAAMGGEPLAAFLSLALERQVPQKWVDGFMRGFLSLAREVGVTLAGGDTAQSNSGILADIVVLGSLPKGRAVLRSGARPGDQIYVTGHLGGSAAAVSRLQLGKARERDYQRHFHPVPRLEQGFWLRRQALASAMIDISDGLSNDLEHLCHESGVGAELTADLIPRAVVGRPSKTVGMDLALHGGEDYELLFTSARLIPARLGGVPVTRIGRITSRRRLVLVSALGKRERLVMKGWEHFKNNLA